MKTVREEVMEIIETQHRDINRRLRGIFIPIVVGWYCLCIGLWLGCGK